MPRILAFDDDPLARVVLIDALRGLGHEGVGAADVQEACARLDAEPFVLVVGVGLAGVELARRVQGLAQRVPVVLVTGADRAEVAERARAVGAPIAGFVAAPVDADRLGAVVDAVLSTRPATESAVEWSGVEFLHAIAGTLERFPPARVLFLAHRVEAFGAIEIAFGDVRATIGVRGGRVVRIAGVPGLLRHLDPKFPEYGELGAAIGAAVVEGHPADQAMAAAAEALGEFLARLVTVRGGSVRFDTAFVVPPGSFPLPESIPRLIAVGQRRARTEAQLTRTWEALEAAQVRARLPEDSPETRWGLDSTALRVLRLAGKAPALGTLLATAAGADEARRVEVMRAIDLLYLLGLVIVDGGPLEPVQRRPVARAEATQEDDRLVRLRAALAAMEGAHPLDVLELGDRRQLTDVDVANAYREVSRRFHPDTFFTGPPVIRGLAEACFAQVNAAYEALRLPLGITEARAMLEARATGVAFVTERDSVSARVAFRRAEILWRNRDWKGADALFGEACRLSPRTWPYALYHAWCGRNAKRLALEQAIAALDALQPPEPQRQAEVLVVTGHIFKAEGRQAEALARYRDAAARHPENRDAQRELRLHQSRTSPTPPAGGGFLDGLLNRKR